MNKKNRFSLEEDVFNMLLTEKKKSKFKNKSWDDWFIYLITKSIYKSKSKTYKEKIENIVNNFYEKNFSEEWIKNFAINLPNIWIENSAKTLEPSKNFYKNSSIVIGRGPSLKKNKHLQLLAESDYQGTIVCADGILSEALEAGVTPKKFPNFFVVTIDPHEKISNYYKNKIIDKYDKKIKGIFSVVTNPKTVEQARKRGIKIHWIHTLFDYNLGKKSFNQMSSLMIRVKNHKNGLPAIQTGGNVGTSSWFISWRILKCNPVTLIGINHGWEANDPIDLIVSHGKALKSQDIKKNSLKFQRLFPKIYNPEFKTYCILDPIFQFYREAFLEFINRSPKEITTINSTEGGSIFGKQIKCLTFKEFLKLYKN